MKGARATAVCWVLAISFFWSFGCSLIQPIIPEDKPPVTPPPPKPVSIQPPTIEPQPKSQPKQIAPPPEVKYLTHTIKWSGENLIRISRWYTGSGNNWLRLVDANPSIDPRRIKIGDSIRIPESLLKTREPMPISYLSSILEQQNTSSAPPAEPTPSTKDVELFGPIDTDTQTGRVETGDSILPLETIE